jgi:hypothetical protein
VLTVLAPWGVQHYSSGTAEAVLDYADPGARLVFSYGWHISRDGKDIYSWKLKVQVPVRRQLFLPMATIILAGLEPSSLVHHRAV